MTSHRLRLPVALLAALLLASILKFALIDIGALSTSASSAQSFWSALLQTIGYGLPLGAIAIAATELFRLRRPDIQIAIGTFLTFFAAYVSTRNEGLASHVYSGGALTTLALLAIGASSSLLYWVIAGRQAGWRGEKIENADELAIGVFRRASAQAQVRRCGACLAACSAIGAVCFALLAWILIDGSGFRARLIADAEAQGRVALATSGFAWATFNINGNRGVIAGQAPDELEKRAAYDAVRETLSSVIGFPGVVSSIDNKTVASLPTADVSQKLAEAERREQQAKKAAEEAQRLALAARQGEEAAKRQAVEQAAAANAELAVKLEQEKIRAKEEALKQAAEALAKRIDAAPADANRDDASSTALVAPTADEVGATSPESSNEAATCTEQDLAMVETSRILFDPQTFEVAPRFERDLDRIAASVRACAPRPVQVAGYSDSNDDRLFNPALGLQRAESVRDSLIARGVAATRIVTKATPLGLMYKNDLPVEERVAYRRSDFKFLEISELSRDATQRPDERAINCEGDLSGIMSQSIIHFPIASARVSQDSMGLIVKLANAIKACGSVIITIEGHTDKVGTTERNQQLSEARANSVREALVGAGADPTRLASRGFASSRPFDTAETAEAYAMNRRIEFKVSGKFTTTQAGGP